MEINTFFSNKRWLYLLISTEDAENVTIFIRFFL